MSSPMRNSVAALAAFWLLAACDGNPLTVDEEVTDTPVEEEPLVEEDEVEVTEDGIPVVVARNLQQIVYDPVAKTLQVTIAGLDGTPTLVSYTRNPTAENGLPDGYEAYSIQEDPLDRYFVGVVKHSFDNSVRAGAVSDGGQFTRFFSGGYFERTGGFDKPASGDGPGEGQVSYAGGYVGLDNWSGPFPPMPPGTDPSIQPQGPGRVTGQVFINANFDDMQLNGSIFNRQAIDRPGLVNLTDLYLVVTDITDDGKFIGSVDTPIGGTVRPVGDYAGLFGGTDSSSVGGVIYIENYIDQDVNGNPIVDEAETGVFVLNQCGMPGANATLCNGTAP